jgi:alanyl-tRNA synthetase
MTNRLYYDDSYTTDFDAQVVEKMEVKGQQAVILDRSYFYPAGGGQPSDLGWINEVPVIDVFSRMEDRAVVHVLNGKLDQGNIAGRIDWARRFDIMQQHTGQHILTRAFIEAVGADTVAFHLGDESVTIDLNVSSLETEMMDRAEDLANQIVIANGAVTARFITQEEFDSMKVRTRKIPDHAASEGLRIVDVEGFDITTCGGTHVARTGEIGLIKITKLERSGQETRVEFKCGGRALRDYRVKTAVSNRLVAELTVGQAELDQAVMRLKGDLRESRTSLKDAQSRLVEYEAHNLLSTVAANNGIRLICNAYEDRDPGEIRAIVSRIVEEPDVIAVIGLSGDKAQVITARSANLPHNMNDALKRALDALGTGKGGGRPEFAQGGGMVASKEQIDAALTAAIDGLI